MEGIMAAAEDDQSDFFRGLALRVAPSVVIVENTATNSYQVGSVIHKTKLDTFVLTHHEITREADLIVHFSDNSTRPAECLVSEEGSFAIIAIGEAHISSRIIKLKDPVDDSDVLTLVPKSTTTFEKIRGFISNASCSSASGNDPADEIRDSEKYFIASCCHQETKLMLSAPVFDKNGRANGFVVSDCRDKHDDGIIYKICLKASSVEKELEFITKGLKGCNWKQSLSILSDRARREREEKKNRKRPQQNEAVESAS